MHHEGAICAVMQHSPEGGIAGATLSFPIKHHATMLDSKLFETISAQISATLAATPLADVEKNLRAMLTAQFAKLDLVTREDFEVQKNLLAHAQTRLAALEARLAEIEAQRKP